MRVFGKGFENQQSQTVSPSRICFKAVSAMSWLLSRRCTIRVTSRVKSNLFPLSRNVSTSSKTIFQTSSSAEFLASVTDVNSFPRFNRLPEVSRVSCYKMILLHAKKVIVTGKLAQCRATTGCSIFR